MSRVVMFVTALAAATAVAQSWQHTCEFDSPLDQLTPRFHVSASDGGLVSTDRGMLRFSSSAGGAAFLAIGTTRKTEYVDTDTWGDAAAWQGSGPSTVEAQMRVVSPGPSGGAVALLQVSHGWFIWTLYIGPDGIHSGNTCVVPFDATKWHVYRISMSQGQANGFVDDKPIPAECLKASAHQRDALLIGDFSSRSAGVSEWNYIRWTNQEAEPFTPVKRVNEMKINDLFEISDLSFDVPAAVGGNLAVLEGGRILLAYTGPVNPHGREPGTVRIYGRVSEDGGLTWGEGRELIVRPECQACGPSLLRADDGRLWLFYMGFYRSVWKDGDPLFPDCRSDLWAAYSDDEGDTWQGDRCIWQGYTGATNGAIQTKSGAIILPFSYDVTGPGRLVSTCLVSRDGGGTWQQGAHIDLGGHGDHGGAMEPTVVELRDGRVLMLIRTTMGAFYRAFSSDDGMTWTKAERTDIESPSSPCYLKRLASGRIAIVWNNTMATTKGRDSIHIALSDDEAQTWSEPIKIGTAGQLSYPYVLEIKPGRLLILANHVQGGWTVIAPVVVLVDEASLVREQG